MNNLFIQNVLTHGKEGKKWLKEIPKIISAFEKKWSLKVLSPFPNLSYNYVAPVLLPDGSGAVLKIGFPTDKEFQTEINALEIFNGEGAEKLLREDREHAVILIERVLPGIPLDTIPDDEKATRILAGVMKKLWKPLPKKNTFIRVREWMQAIPQYLGKYKQKRGPLPDTLVRKAERLFDELIITSKNAVLVHGDLHQGNVLSSDRSDWLAIDPKGIAAEPAYETAAMIRNPYEIMKNKNNSELEHILYRRIHILSEKLGFDPQRILKWCFAQTVLSAVWNYEEVKGAEHAIRIATILDALKI